MIYYLRHYDNLNDVFWFKATPFFQPVSAVERLQNSDLIAAYSRTTSILVKAIRNTLREYPETIFVPNNGTISEP